MPDARQASVLVVEVPVEAVWLLPPTVYVGAVRALNRSLALDDAPPVALLLDPPPE